MLPFFNGGNMPCSDSDMMILMLRVIIDDIDAESYSDSKLLKILGASTKIVLSEVRLGTDYTATIDLSTPSLDICPAITDAVCSLIVLKSACLLDQMSLKNNSILEGIRAQCGPMVMQKTSGGQMLSLLIAEGSCRAYRDLKEKIEFYDPLATGEYVRAVIGPFISNTYLCNYCGARRGYCGCGR